MKKVFMSVVILLSVATLSQAQGLGGGIKAGANLNKISGQSFNDGFDLSYHFGGFLEIDINKKWGFQPELLWSQTTSKPSSFRTVYTNNIHP